MFWSKKSQVPESDAHVLFLFIAGVLSVVLLGVVINFGAEPPKAVDETAPPSDIRPVDALPAGAGEIAASVPVTPSVNPTWLFGYVRDGKPRVALVSWNRRTGRFALMSELSLGIEAYRMERVDSVSRVASGWGPGIFFEVLGGADDGDMMAYVVVDGQDLERVVIVDSSGSRRAAAFRTDEARAFDITGNGAMEVVVMQDGESSVYVWRDGHLRRDERLSQAMTIREGLFPEPEPIPSED